MGVISLVAAVAVTLPAAASTVDLGQRVAEIWPNGPSLLDIWPNGADLGGGLGGSQDSQN
jgi:hypothetical protein